jgi:molybdopterin molybdotransferase
MITVEKASAIILQNCYTPAEESVPLTDAVGRVLAEQIIADRDFPPFDRVAMDGISISFDQLKFKREFQIEDLQAAGQPIKHLKDKTQCIEVMTGAVLPVGTDTVIRYEDVIIKDGMAAIGAVDIRPRQNVHSQGQDARSGEILVEAGATISPAEIALLATVGRSAVRVKTLPRAAVVASGDELVAVSDTPLAHQIRRSNTYALQGAMKKIGWQSEQFHLPDDRETLYQSLTLILADHDVVILSGGVSKGKFDYVPEILQQAGIRQVFHQVSQRPGKPFWFGVSDSGKVVFALPGNPVSTFMCFHRFVKPWLLKSLGIQYDLPKAILATDFTFEPKLTYFLQVAVKNEQGRLIAYPEAGGGSGDFANLKDVDGFLELPLEKTVFRAGEVFDFIPFRA